MLNQINLYKHL